MNERSSAAQVPPPTPRVRTYAFDWVPPADRIWRDAEGARLFDLATTGSDGGRDFLDRVHPDDRAQLSAAIAGLSPQQPDYRLRYRVRIADGRERVIDEHAMASFDAGGQPVRVLGIAADVTACCEEERLLREGVEAREAQLELLSGIMDRVPALIMLYDPQLRDVRVNRELERRLGWTKLDLNELDLLEVCCPDPAQRTLAREWLAGPPTSAANDAEAGWRDIRMTAKDGTELDIAWASVALNERHRVALGIDVGPRKRAEQALRRELTEQRRAEDRLAASNARFRSMAETVPDILFTADAKGHCDYVNQRFERVTGMAAEQALGLGWLEAVHPEDRDAAAAAWRRALKRSEGLAYRYRLCCADGAWRWFETRIRPIQEAVGGRRWFGAASDIDELVRAREALEDADKQKNEFLAILGHELRNPMAPVRSAVDVMTTVAPEHPKLQWAIGVIDRQSRHMERLLDDLLDVSRIVRGKLSLETRVVPVGEIVDQAVDGAMHLIEARRHHFAIDLPDEPVYLDADPARLSQVLINLLTNAAKYTAEGGHIRLAVEGRAGLCVIRVSDDGEGIDPELRAGLFDAFTQGRRRLNRAPGGLGLGLTIAARLTELHGGRIEVHSQGLGKGAEFALFLPRCDAPSVAAPASDDEQTAAVEPPRILVVDDDPDVAHGMAMLLEVLGYPAQMCLSGAEALNVAERFQPRLVLLDIGMGDMDGFETARRLRAAHADPQRMRLVAVSGYGDAGFQARGRQAGFDQHLIKPVGREDLLRLLRSLDDPEEAA